jgi:glyoxylate/hydroxypyruvate reductase A
MDPIRIAVALTNMKPESWLAPLQAAFRQRGIAAQFELFNGKPIGARYAIVWQPPAELFARERKLQAIFNVGAGVEGLLALAGLPLDVPVLRLVDAGMAPKMAEYVSFFVARITRGLDRFGGPQALRDWEVDRPRGVLPGIGVMGLGAIGAHIARVLLMTGYPVLGWSRTPKELPGLESFAGAANLKAFLGRANILVNVLPLTYATRDLLNRERFAWLPAHAWVINVGRGGTIVDADLIAALDSGQLAGAVLDVFREEPLPAAHPFWHHDRIIVTPHLSGPTPREPAALQIVEAVERLEAGVAPELLPGFVERARGY